MISQEEIDLVEVFQDKSIDPENVMRSFGDNLVAAVSTTSEPDKYLPVRQIDGELLLDVIPEGFHLAVGVPRGSRTIVVQKHVGTDLGGYARDSLIQLGGSMGIQFTMMQKPIRVQRAGRNIWTSWHVDESPNRVDCWTLQKDGTLILDQAGVITHDDGKTWRLHCETRWHGKLFNHNGKPVACPKEPRIKWGPFVTWQKIFDDPQFKKLLSSAHLEKWTGKPIDIEPPLPHVREGHAVMQWFIPFAGQTGFGYAYLSNGRKAVAVHGTDVLINPDNDGVKRLWRGDIVSYSKLAEFGSKKTLKLCNVELFSRSW